MKYIITNFGPTYPLGIGGGSLSNIDLSKLLQRLGNEVTNLGFFEQENFSEYIENFKKAQKLSIVKGSIYNYYCFNKINCINKSWEEYLRALDYLSSSNNTVLIFRPYNIIAKDNIGLWNGRFVFWNNDFDINRAKEGVKIAREQKGRVVVISKMLKEMMDKKYGIKADVVHSVIDWKNLRMAPKNHFKNKKRKPIIGLPNPNRFKFGSLPLKIIDSLPDYTFFVVTAWGWEEESLMKLKSRKNVVLLRNIVDVGSFYKAIDILLVPTILPESYPRFIQEALYLRIPIVASAIGELPEFIGSSGILVKSNNVKLWKSAVNSTINIPFSELEKGRIKIKDFQKNAFSTMEKYFTKFSNEVNNT